jgi:hypothetical protein
MTPEEEAAFVATQELQKAYRQAFGSPAGKLAMEDLAIFCRSDRTCVVAPRGQPVDRERTLVLEGRREVWLRIQDFITMPTENLHAFRGPQRRTREDDDA